MSSLLDLPLENLTDMLLPYLPLSSIAALALTSKYFATLCSDEIFWKRKLREDYNFSDASIARTSGGYKLLYRAFCCPKLYVWGDTEEGSLGLDHLTAVQHQIKIGRWHIPYPNILDVPGPRIVKLAVGEWSFHALDANGDVHVWGKLDALAPEPNIGRFARSTEYAPNPLKLALPEKITQISCGRKHAAALFAANRVWVFTAWGTPYVMTSPAFDERLRQVECGWNFIAVLTQAGEVSVWWPFTKEFGQRLEDTRQMVIESRDYPVQIDGVVQCRPWDVDLHPKQIPGITCELPRLHDRETSQDKIVKVAGGDNFLIALTEGGHVLRTDFEHGHKSFRGQPRWKYLPLFSEMTRIRSLPTFPSENNNGLVVQENMHITDISAHIETFFSCMTGSHSILLQGKRGPLPILSVESTPPVVSPVLQNKVVKSVALGAFHFGVVTADWKLLTWGQYSDGALGLGDPTVLPIGAPGGYPTQEQQRTNADTVPPDVLEPTEVKFGTHNGREGRKVLVLTAAAAGWHTCALVAESSGGL